MREWKLRAWPQRHHHIANHFGETVFRTRDIRGNQTSHRQRISSRRGVTLIELVVALTMFSFMMTLSGMTFHLLMRSEKMVSQSFVTERALSKLAIDFRDDVHRAKSGTMPASEGASIQQLDLDFTDGTSARYLIDKNRVTRSLMKADTLTAREDFRLPDCQIRFAPVIDSDPRVRRLIIERPAPTMTRNSRAPQPKRPIVMDAYLGRWNAVRPNPDQEPRNGPANEDDNKGATP